MDKIFFTIFNMSLTGTFVIVAICLARLPLKKAPKIISYFQSGNADSSMIILICPFMIYRRV